MSFKHIYKFKYFGIDDIMKFTVIQMNSWKKGGVREKNRKNIVCACSVYRIVFNTKLSFEMSVVETWPAALAQPDPNWLWVI